MSIKDDLDDFSDSAADVCGEFLKKHPGAAKKIESIVELASKLKCWLQRKTNRLMSHKFIRIVVCHLLLIAAFIFKFSAFLAFVAVILSVMLLALFAALWVIVFFLPISGYIAGAGIIFGLLWYCIHDDAKKWSNEIEMKLEEKENLQK